jgi:tRNA(adenine34) deaminase
MQLYKQYIIYLLLLCLITIPACRSSGYYSSKIIQPVLETTPIDSVQQEKENIFSLLTYAIVFDDWQPDSIPRDKRRGYNIGALLVNKDDEPVQYGLNSINSTENSTQHGEVISITSYLNRTRQFNLEGFTIYTTLEPCVMCAGMITMTSVKKVVYGQHDVEYSKAFERLALDTRPIGGFPPYPRKVTAVSSPLLFCKQLDDAYHSYLETADEKILAKFLSTNEAYSIFKNATEVFLSYSVKNESNKKVYQKAMDFYKALKK